MGEDQKTEVKLSDEQIQNLVNNATIFKTSSQPNIFERGINYIDTFLNKNYNTPIIGSIAKTRLAFLNINKSNPFYSFSPFGTIDIISNYLLGKTEPGEEFAVIAPGATKIVSKKTIPNSKQFVSELDWSPESWFGDAAGRTDYGILDKAALNSHIPEYLEIEKAAKTTGINVGNKTLKWLEMPDGSKWTGDPRSWVLLMSKNGQAWIPEHHWTGVNASNVYNFKTYNGDIWSDMKSPTNVEEYATSPLGGGMSFNERTKILTNYPSAFESGITPELLKTIGIAPKYADDIRFFANGKIFDVTIPKNTKVLQVDALGRHWGSIPYKTQYESTDYIVDEAKEANYGATRVDNVMDSKYGNLLNDFIIHKGTPRKSLLGNNGNFSQLSKNIYWSVFPLGLLPASYYYDK